MSVVSKKTTCRLLAVLAVGLLVASTLTLAAEPARDGVITSEEGPFLKDFNARHGGDRDGAPPIRLPEPINTIDGGGTPKAGLVGSGIGMSQNGGSAIVAPRGGAMMSAAERADQAIRTVIRRLG